MKFIVTTDVLGVTTVRLHNSTKRKIKKIAAGTVLLTAAVAVGYKKPELIKSVK